LLSSPFSFDPLAYFYATVVPKPEDIVFPAFEARIIPEMWIASHCCVYAFSTIVVGEPT